MTDMDALKIAQTELGHLPLSVALPVANVAQSAGLPTDQLLFVFFLLACVPLGWAHQFVPGQTLKHVTCFILGFCVVYGMIGWGVIHLFITSTLVYAGVEFMLPSGKAKLSSDARDKARQFSQRIGNAVFVFCMGYLCISHIYRQYTNYLGYAMDFTAPQMVATLKLVAYAWSRVDGEALNANERLSDNDRENVYRAERAIPERPSVLSYFAWMFFFPGVFAGPAIDYSEYQQHVTGEAYKKFGLKRAPFTPWPALQKILFALCAYPGIIVAGRFPIFGYANTEAFYTNTTVWYRIGYITLFTAFARAKYYFAWYLAEAGAVAAGLGLSSYDPETKAMEWNGMTNCRALGCETSCSVKDLTLHWNIRTSEWLKHYVYFRVPTNLPVISRIMSHTTFANIVTKFTSAFWHGFYPGYYIFFLQLVIVQMFETPYRAFFSIFLSQNSLPFKVLTYLFTMGSFSWLGASFVLLEAGPAWRLLVDSYFFYHIIGAIVCLGIFPIFIKRAKHAEKKKDEPITAAVISDAAAIDDKVESKAAKETKSPRK